MQTSRISPRALATVLGALTLPFLACASGAPLPEADEPGLDRDLPRGNMVAQAGAPAPTPSAPAAAPRLRAPSEPADAMEVQGTTGTLNPEQVEHPFRERWSEVMRCFAETSRRQPYVGGHLLLQVTVGPSGEASQVALRETMGAGAAERCILALTRSFRWERPDGGANAEFTYPIEFPRRHGIVGQQDLHEKVARRFKRTLAPVRFRACNAPAGAVMGVYVGRRGKVVSAGVSGAEADAASCLTAKARELRMPDPRIGVAYLTVQL
jgi:hypothetical protein